MKCLGGGHTVRSSRGRAGLVRIPWGPGEMLKAKPYFHEVLRVFLLGASQSTCVYTGFRVCVCVCVLSAPSPAPPLGATPVTNS